MVQMSQVQRNEEKMIKVILEKGAILPQRAYTSDGGLDLFARETQHIPAKEYIHFDTGVHIDIPKGYVGLIKNKSGLCFKNNLICDEGVIDSGYTGTLNVKIFNLFQQEVPHF